jgi:cell wall-associated NlpC family hydrolase
MIGLVGKAAAGGTGLLVAAAAILTSGLQALATPTVTPTTTASTDIPAAYLRDYQHAATACPNLTWTLLAGVGKVESDHGRAASLVSPTGAQGPMQFEPATWARYGVDADSDGHADPFDPADAIAAAADYLCALGVGHNPTNALIAYNCGNTGPACQAASADYAALVLSWAARYGRATTSTTAAGPVAAQAIRAALAQVGTPYLWGGESRSGFDCSGLIQWSYAHAGITLPRVSQAQYDAGPHLPAGAPLQPGDLVFFGGGPTDVHHVGLYLGNDRMVDAPHTGAFVRVEPITGFDPPYVGATRPANGAHR